MGLNCSLCGKGKQSKYFYLKSWKDPSLLQNLQQVEPSLDIQPDSCISRQCRLDGGKLCEDPSITPRWEKTTTVKQCYTSGCTSTDIKVGNIESDTMLQFVGHDENMQTI